MKLKILAHLIISFLINFGLNIKSLWYYFAEWAKSKGDLYSDWYKDKDKYRDYDALYIVK
jgi:hypothetical protein